MLYIIVHCTIWKTLFLTFTDVIGENHELIILSIPQMAPCSSAYYCELPQAFPKCQHTLFMALQTSNRLPRSTCKLVRPHIFVSPPPSHRLDRNQFKLLGEQRHLGVSSLSKAISQKPSNLGSNSQPCDHKSETLTTRPRAHSQYSGWIFRSLWKIVPE